MRTLWLSVAGARLHAWLVVPNRDPPWPLVVMAHGWGAVKEMNLDLFAAAMSDVGLATLVFDHRGFGASTGIRFDIDPEHQIRDYQAALTFAAGLPEVDERRLAVWGTSFSGGHVLRLAERDGRVRTAVAQVPTISGGEMVHRRFGGGTPEAVRQWASERKRLAAGMAPTYVQVADVAGHEIPGSQSLDRLAPVAPERLPAAPTGMCTDDERWRFYAGLPELRRRTWRNLLTLTSQERYAAYEPGTSLPGVAVPLLVIFAESDTITPTDLIEQALSGAGANVASLSVPGGHYSVYGTHRERCARAAAAFLAEHLDR
ncbi:MAG TPA: alpha/beta fold hydrolase [Solirubrobacteraceae bacterium]|nr:alpha/beta fold hydrolase [Solirubrobacteraceae bacterium]